MKKGYSTPQKLAATTVFTALVCVATMAFSIYVPQTRGYFNIGEGMVYITALLFGPAIGSFAGGVGSMFADLLLGYVQFAPATLVSKACEGYIVGFLSHKVINLKSKTSWKVFAVIGGLVASTLLVSIGVFYYSGDVELYVGLPPPPIPTIVLGISPAFWYILGCATMFFIVASGFKLEPELGKHILSILLGGTVMVVGYYIYEQFVMGVFAAAEVPINIGQMIVGLTIALPVTRAVKRVLPYIVRE